MKVGVGEWMVGYAEGEEKWSSLGAMRMTGPEKSVVIVGVRRRRSTVKRVEALELGEELAAAVGVVVELEEGNGGRGARAGEVVERMEVEVVEDCQEEASGVKE